MQLKLSFTKSPLKWKFYLQDMQGTGVELRIAMNYSLIKVNKYQLGTLNITLLRVGFYVLVIRFILPHFLVLQYCFIVLLPEHFLPPCFEFLIIVLLLFLIPLPQDLEQEDHLPQEDHRQFTEKINENFFTFIAIQTQFFLYLGTVV